MSIRLSEKHRNWLLNLRKHKNAELSSPQSPRNTKRTTDLASDLWLKTYIIVYKQVTKTERSFESIIIHVLWCTYICNFRWCIEFALWRMIKGISKTETVWRCPEGMAESKTRKLQFFLVNTMWQKYKTTTSNNEHQAGKIGGDDWPAEEAGILGPKC